MDELLVREFTEDRELTAWLLLDRSPSMAFGAAGRTKEDLLCELGATFAQLLPRGGNRVGAIVFDGERQRTLRPGQGRSHVLAVVDELLRPVGGSRALISANCCVRRESWFAAARLSSSSRTFSALPAGKNPCCV